MSNFILNRSHNWDFQQSIGALVKGTEVLYWSFVRTGLKLREQATWFLLFFTQMLKTMYERDCESSQDIF